MARVIDYAWGRPGIAALRAAGAVAVCRYLSYNTTGKNLSAAEAAVLTTAGIGIVSNWEAAGSWAELSGGFAAGVRHAREAQRQHTACGGPVSRPIYFSVDFDATAGQLATVGDYFRGVASILGLDRAGAYGGYRVIKYLFDHGLIRWGWQTYAWSGGQWDSRAHLRQVRNGVSINGVDCDLNDSTAADFGAWGTGVPLTIVGGTMAAGSIAEMYATQAATYGWAALNLADTLDVPYPGNNPNAGPYKNFASPLAALLKRVDANVAADLAEDKATTAAINALVGLVNTAGGNLDAAPILSAIADVRAEESAAVKALHDQLATVGARLAAALDQLRRAVYAGAQAEAAAAQTPPTG